MRKSKSNPAKYTRNYRKISQRHMTDNGSETPIGENSRDNYDDGGKKRLESVLKNAEQTLKRGLGHFVEDENDILLVGGKRKRNNLSNDRLSLIATTSDKQLDTDVNDEGMLSLLSPELQEQFSGMSDKNLIILPSGGGKKSSKTKELPPLTPAEIKSAKALCKNTKRKLSQLEQRRIKNEVRSGLYTVLEENSLLSPATGVDHDGENDGIELNQLHSGKMGKSKSNSEPATVKHRLTPEEASGLLLKSSELGKKLSKKQKLKHLRQKEALGLELTKEEIDLLYVRYEVPNDDTSGGRLVKDAPEKNLLEADHSLTYQDVVSCTQVESNELGNCSGSVQKGRNTVDSSEVGESINVVADSTDLKPKEKVTDRSHEEERAFTCIDDRDKICTKRSNENVSSPSDHTLLEKTAQSYAQMMYAGLSSLRAVTDAKTAELTDEKELKKQKEEEEALRLEKEMKKHRKVYVPSETIKVSTMHRYDAKSDDNDKHRNVRKINRPAEVEESRFDLPVSAMEYEIVDAIRSNDCTIICGETGSGKSTQVVQFLYEAGFSTISNSYSNDKKLDTDQHLLIGITQPRRVAAVSTAKRVCYEMGHGDGQRIGCSRKIKARESGNLVAYQTRYETAGLGSLTHIKFMTDGILLQEIQSDLLLRKYGVVVIDEAHERNLNTDVLLGLLSKSLALRGTAAEEGSLPPLKLVIMSATLRVEDFMENSRLFPNGGDGVVQQPALVKVPGRTFPVSIHHSKVTELDDYEKAAFDKVCKIHRNLPSGGILVFLTGKQEILRMVHKLLIKFEPDNTRASRDRIDDNVAIDGDGFRDMDDDEIDGDLFQREDSDSIDEIRKEESTGPTLGDNEKQPANVRILPLYSMLSADEQSEVFSTVPEDTRLIVVATNIAETSITIPGICYVVDSGRQKCRNYHSGTGVSSYDVMWISKAAADQRAGRAGRTGPGHCYRLYSSSVYSRYLDEFSTPEVLTRPLEDVVLAMKTMQILNVADFPFPTAPEKTQVIAAVKLLANLGLIDTSKDEGDGIITSLGASVARLPLGARYGKMLLVAAQANVLDYGIAVVAVLSESSPFMNHSEARLMDQDRTSSGIECCLKGLDEIDQNQVNESNRRKIDTKWIHDGGDILSTMMALGGYAYAGRGAGGASEKVACRQFCKEYGLNLVVMQRIAKMRLHLCKLAQARLQNAQGVAMETGKYLSSLGPPKRMQECLLRQAITSGLIDNVARRAPPGVLPQEFSNVPRSAYISCSSAIKEPLYIDNNSTLHSKRPEWVCFDSLVRKKKKDGSTVVVMQRITKIEPEWLAAICRGSKLMLLGSPLATPNPRYIREADSLECAVETSFGAHSWRLPPLYVGMNDFIQDTKKQNYAVVKDDSFRWFARYLLEGRVLLELSALVQLLNDEPSIITRRRPLKKVILLVNALSSAGVDSAAALRKHWAVKDQKYLFKIIKPWVRDECQDSAKSIWIAAVTANIESWKQGGSG